MENSLVNELIARKHMPYVLVVGIFGMAFYAIYKDYKISMLGVTIEPTH